MPAVDNHDFAGFGKPLTDADMQSALLILGLDPITDMPLLWAVLVVESRGFGFFANRKPKLLFERHIFHRETNGRFANAAPDLSAKTGGGYVGGVAEYDRLNRALMLCRRAGLKDEPALRSASWGLGQVMGFNAVTAGFDAAQDMVTKMVDSESAQLMGMVQFMSSEGLDKKLRARDWAGFARRYNGSNYWKNEYDVKLKSAYEKFSTGVSRDLRARAAQAALFFLGYRPGDPDGVIGQNTRKAIAAFRIKEGMGSSDALDDQVFDVIMKKAGLG